LKGATADTIRLVGGTLCLDFVNTVIWDAPGKTRPQAGDVLSRPEHLVAWGTRLGVLGSSVAPAEAVELAATRTLRAAVHEIFALIATGGAPPDDALRRLHGIYAEGVDHAELAERGDGWHLTWPSDNPRSVRFAVAAGAVDLLADEAQLARVRQCPGRDCGGLFVDSSGRRRWCSMEACGSREKMRRYYERQRAAGEDTTAGR
jgi:predicted RNA-binding Zn ribbon-like protein